MALQLGGVLGAVTNLTTAFSEEKSLKSFLKHIDRYGAQVQNNFEINFSGIQDLTFYATAVSLPSLHQNFTELYFGGRQVEIPINYDFDKDFSVTLINDAQGYIYSAVTNFLMSEASNYLLNSGFTMTIKALTGDSNYKGSLYTIRGVRCSSISPLQYGYANNDISTFDLSLKCIDFTVTPGAAGKVAGILGAVNSIIK